MSLELGGEDQMPKGAHSTNEDLSGSSADESYSETTENEEQQEQNFYRNSALGLYVVYH